MCWAGLRKLKSELQGGGHRNNKEPKWQWTEMVRDWNAGVETPEPKRWDGNVVYPRQRLSDNAPSDNTEKYCQIINSRISVHPVFRKHNSKFLFEI